MVSREGNVQHQHHKTQCVIILCFFVGEQVKYLTCSCGVFSNFLPNFRIEGTTVPMSSFLNPYPDFAQLESLLSNEQKQTQLTVRSFVQNEIEPKIVKAYRSEEFPVGLLAQMGAMGLLGANLSGYGLPGMDTVS